MDCHEITLSIKIIKKLFTNIDSSDLSRIDLSMLAKVRINEIINNFDFVEKMKSIDHAKEIMGPEQFFGRDEINKVFGFEPGILEIPLMSFTDQELINAKKLGMKLILRIDKDRDNNPMNISRMVKLEKMTHRYSGVSLGGGININGENVLIDESPRLCWALVDTGLEFVLRENYAGNLFDAAIYVKENLIIEDRELMDDIYQSIDEVRSKWSAINQLIKKNNLKDNEIGSAMINELKFVKTFIPSLSEIFYDCCLINSLNKEKVLSDKAIWTNRMSDRQSFIIFGHTKWGNQIFGYPTAVKDIGVVIAWRK